MVLPTGFEPVTLGFRDRSSTAELKAAHGVLSIKLQAKTPEPRAQIETHECDPIEREARRKELRG